MRIVRWMGATLAGGALVVSGFAGFSGVAAADTNPDVSAGAVTLSRPAPADAPAKVCAEGTMLIERDGGRRIEHPDCSVTDVMGVTVTRDSATGAVFGEREVPAMQATGASAAGTAQIPTVVERTSQSLPVSGADVLPMAVGGLGALAMGGAAVVMARRNRAAMLEVAAGR